MIPQEKNTETESIYITIEKAIFWERRDRRRLKIEKLAIGWQAIWQDEKDCDPEAYDEIDLSHSFTLEPGLIARLEEFTGDADLSCEKEALRMILHTFLAEHGYN